jgi:DnaJ-class molecular chaperone
MVAVNPYSVLGLNSNATPEQVRSAYRRLAMQYHPDVNPTRRDYATARMAEINAAYTMITSGSAARNRYTYNPKPSSGRNLFDMSEKGERKIRERVLQYAESYQDAKFRAGMHYRWFGFGPEAVKKYKDGLRDAELNNLDPDKWATNWRRAMRQ